MVEGQQVNEVEAKQVVAPRGAPWLAFWRRPSRSANVSSEVAQAPRKKRRIKRALLIAAASTVALAGGFSFALHEFPSFGPWCAESARKVLGPGPVAWAEDTYYGVTDWINVRTRADEAPTTYWENTPTNDPIVVVNAEGRTVVLDPKVDAPAPFTAPFDKVAASGDGSWSAFRVSSDTSSIAMWRGLVHPDPKRPFAAVAVVAMDLHQIDLHVVAGTDEPKSQHVPRASRPGLVPSEDQPALMAAFNGGFRAEHGQYGMRIGTDQFIAPRDIACTVAKDSSSGELTIRTFSAIKDDDAKFSWYRQTPPCLVEGGEPHPGLSMELNRNWGAAVGGDTVIRRSALGISKDGHYLFYALGDAVTAQSIGKAMMTVGAHYAAQLDVNFSYPRFFLFEHGTSGPSIAETVIPGLKHKPTEFVQISEDRDFFYVTRKKAPKAKS